MIFRELPEDRQHRMLREALFLNEVVPYLQEKDVGAETIIIYVPPKPKHRVIAATTSDDRVCSGAEFPHHIEFWLDGMEWKMIDKLIVPFVYEVFIDYQILFDVKHVVHYKQGRRGWTTSDSSGVILVPGEERYAGYALRVGIIEETRDHLSDEHSTSFGPNQLATYIQSVLDGEPVNIGRSWFAMEGH
jgi:hypothetical protein